LLSIFAILRNFFKARVVGAEATVPTKRYQLVTGVFSAFVGRS